MQYMVREWLSTVAIRNARSFGRLLGCELVVDASTHSLETSMEMPDREQRAWDPDLYKHGQLYVAGYANPIKPVIEHNAELEEPDTVHIQKGEAEADDGLEESDDDTTAAIITSERYKTYMQQDLISQLLNPREQWRLLVYGIIALGALQFIAIIITMYATGAF